MNNLKKVTAILMGVCIMFASCKVSEDTVVNAEMPSISKEPVAKIYAVGETASALTVEAAVSDGGTLSYQWYAAAAEKGDGTAINDEVANSFIPSTAVEGTTFYYCVVTNTNTEVNGLTQISITSSRVSVVVSGVVVVNAVTPVIGTQPVTATYEVGATATLLSVEASVTDAGVLSYQWYSGTSGTADGTEVSGATTSSYTPATNATGTIYYYCVVTNTNDSVNGTKTASAKSDCIAIVVNSATVTNAAVPAITTQPVEATYKVEQVRLR